VYSEEIRKFMIEHEFGRRIAKRVGSTLKNSYRVRTQGKHLLVISRPIPFSYLTILLRRIVFSWNWRKCNRFRKKRKRCC